MHVGDRKRPPLSPQEGWLSDGRQVLHFRPTRWTRHNQVLEVTSGELLLGQYAIQPRPDPGRLLRARRGIERQHREARGQLFQGQEGVPEGFA